MPDTNKFSALDRVLHQPIRTRIAAYLTARGDATFTDLKKALALTDGNLEAHMKKLIQTGYVSVSQKKLDSSRTQSLYAMSAEGKIAFQEYVQALSDLFNMEGQ